MASKCNGSSLLATSLLYKHCMDLDAASRAVPGAVGDSGACYWGLIPSLHGGEGGHLWARRWTALAGGWQARGCMPCSGRGAERGVARKQQLAALAALAALALVLLIIRQPIRHRLPRSSGPALRALTCRVDAIHLCALLSGTPCNYCFVRPPLLPSPPPQRLSPRPFAGDCCGCVDGRPAAMTRESWPAAGPPHLFLAPRIRKGPCPARLPWCLGPLQPASRYLPPAMTGCRP
jgi:hypothetical protein